MAIELDYRPTPVRRNRFLRIICMTLLIATSLIFGGRAFCKLRVSIPKAASATTQTNGWCGNAVTEERGRAMFMKESVELLINEFDWLANSHTPDE